MTNEVNIGAKIKEKQKNANQLQNLHFQFFQAIKLTIFFLLQKVCRKKLQLGSGL